ncbi:MAG: hypothetical protein ACRENH_06425, partial [Gemmatimonadaceae bacterium]
ISLAASAGTATSAQSQQTTPNVRSYVQVIRLKPDMVDEWRAIQRNEVIPAQKKAGVTSRTTLVTQVGNAYEYAILTPFPKWEAMDGEAPLVRALGREGAAQVNAKLRKCVLTQSSYMTNRVDSLTIPADSAPVWRVAVRRALPGKMRDYIAYYRAEVLPGLRKAKASGKIAGSTIAIRGVGATSGEFTTVTYYANFAGLDGGDPLVQALGQEAAARINAKGGELSTATQVVIRRRIADLSF